MTAVHFPTLFFGEKNDARGHHSGGVFSLRGGEKKKKRENEGLLVARVKATSCFCSRLRHTRAEKREKTGQIRDRREVENYQRGSERRHVANHSTGFSRRAPQMARCQTARQITSSVRKMCDCLHFQGVRRSPDRFRSLTPTCHPLHS